METDLVREKIREVRDEMKSNGLWSQPTPDWVKEYEKRTISTGEDFCEWLQFIYLPNRKLEPAARHEPDVKKYIAPQAIKFFSSDINKGRLLRLLIELDSLP